MTSIKLNSDEMLLGRTTEMNDNEIKTILSPLRQILLSFPENQPMNVFFVWKLNSLLKIEGFA